jgi:DNA helicase-2/ATP-dependent DNA helicase PcrA
MVVPFEKLNKEQQTAVTYTGKRRVLVLAGPGTGKTEVLGHRIRWLIDDKKVDPCSILAITFTVKAAQEMLNRLSEFHGLNLSGIKVLTIHGEAWRIVCKNKLEKVAIIDEDEAKMLLQDTVDDLALHTLQIKQIKHQIELNKAYNKLPEDLDKDGNFRAAYRKYEELMKFNKVTDFGGIITDTLRLFIDNKILKECQKNAKYILVDEYQDINLAQFVFIKSLCTENTYLCCVGDDDQSIYGWRGGRPDFILNFERDYPDSEELPLKESRRCSENILNAASNLIAQLPKNKRRPKELQAVCQGGDPIQILKSSSEIQEAFWITGWIKTALSNKQLVPKDILIICRDIELASIVVAELKKKEIPVKYWREGAIFKDPDIKDICAHMRVIVNSADNLALRRCLLSKSVPLVGHTRISNLRKKAQIENQTVWGILSVTTNQSSTQKWQRNADNFVQWIKKIRESVDNMSVEILIDNIIEQLKPAQNNEYIMKLKSFADKMSDITPKKFLNEMVKRRRLDINEGDCEIDNKDEAVAVMSMHSSKGLTYRVVFVLGMEEEMFPKINSNMDEERRLCYVAMTRAKEKLFLCTARRRKGRAAQGLGFYNNPSPFIKDICTGNNAVDIREINNYPSTAKAGD